MTLIFRLSLKFYFVGVSYFRFFANFALRRWKPRVIAVTGSAGKTTMLGLIETQLKGRAHYSHDANSPYGVAFDILGMKGVTGTKWKWLGLVLMAPVRAIYYRRREEIYVVEIDGAQPREVEYMAKWLRPEATVWVSVGKTHAMFFDRLVAAGKFADVESAIAYEFGRLAAETRKLVIIDGDSAAMRGVVDGVKAKVVAVSAERVSGYEVEPERSEFQVGRGSFQFRHPMPWEVGLQLVMLVELMKYLKVEVNYDLSDFVLAPGRSNFLMGRDGLRIVDSSYNAHIISMASVLAMVREMKAREKWLVIGDIVEQGAAEAEEHAKLAELIAGSGARRVVLVGRRTAKYTYPLLRGKMDVVSFGKPQEALRYLEKNLTGKETVIFKGSQYLEWIIEKLLAEPGDVALLARQTAAHRKRRSEWGLK